MNPFWSQNGLFPKRFVYASRAPNAPQEGGGGGGNNRSQLNTGQSTGDDLEVPDDPNEVEKIGEHIKFKHLKEDNLDEDDGQSGSREELVKNLKSLRDSNVDMAEVRRMYGTRYPGVLVDGKITDKVLITAFGGSSPSFPERVRYIRDHELKRLNLSVSESTRREIESILPAPSGNTFDAAIQALSSPEFIMQDDKRTSDFLQRLSLVQINQNTRVASPQQTSSAQEYLQVSDRIQRLKSEIDSRKQAIERRKVALENHRNANAFLKEAQKKTEINWRNWLKKGVLTAGVLGASSLALASTWPLAIAGKTLAFGVWGGGSVLTWPAAGYMMGKKLFTDTPVAAARHQTGNMSWFQRGLNVASRWASGRISNEQDRAKAREQDLEYELEQERTNTRSTVTIPGIQPSPPNQTGYTVEELENLLSEAEDELSQHRASCESSRKRLQEDKKHYEDKRDQMVQQGQAVPDEINNAIRGLETLIDLYSVTDPDKQKALDQTALGATANNSTIVARLSNMPITNDMFDRAIELGKREDDRQIKAQKEILDMPYKENIFEEIHLLGGNQNNGEQGAVLTFLRTDKPVDFDAIPADVQRKAPTLYNMLRKINEENPRRDTTLANNLRRTTKFRADMMLQMSGLMIDEINTTRNLRLKIRSVWNNVEYIGGSPRIDTLKKYLNYNPAVILNEAMRNLGSRPHKFKFTVPPGNQRDARFMAAMSTITNRKELKLIHNLLEVIFRRFEIREETGEIVLRGSVNQSAPNQAQQLLNVNPQQLNDPNLIQRYIHQIDSLLNGQNSPTGNFLQRLNMVRLNLQSRLNTLQSGGGQAQGNTNP